MRIFERQGHYTQIDNIVIDELMRTLTGTQFKVLMVVIRKTVGWGKDEDKISLSQIMNTVGTTNKNSVIEAIRHLESQELIVVHRPGGTAINSFSLNKDYDFASNKTVTTASNKTVTTASNKTVTHKRKPLKKGEERTTSPSEQLYHKELAIKVAQLLGIDHLPIKAQVSTLNTATQWLVSVEATPADIDTFSRWWYSWAKTPPGMKQVSDRWAEGLAQATPTKTSNITPLPGVAEAIARIEAQNG